MTLSALTLLLSLFGALAVNGNSEESYSLRLVDGASRCQGHLQLKKADQDWVGAKPTCVTLEFGHRLCAELGCGFALSVKEAVISERLAVGLCSKYCEDTSLIRCFYRRTESSPHSVELSCADSVRLVSGQTLCSGSLQIQDRSSNQSWTSVCEGALGSQGAEVACRELGCGAPVLQGALSPLGQAFHCEGRESSLMDCPRTQTDPWTCSGPALNLTCSQSVRLVGGASRCKGTIEMEHRGEWRRVAARGLWDLKNAAAVCRELDCGSALSTDRKDGLPSSDVWSVDYECVKEKAAVRNCIVHEYSASHGLELVCSDSVRLVSGQTLCSGSLQIRNQSSDQSWTSVCEGALGRRGTEVLCRELGCLAPRLQGELSPLGQMFQCAGNESALMDCPHTGIESKTCSGPALDITCSEPVRLVGGAHQCEGTLEVQHKGEWRRLGGIYGWSSSAADPVCRHLGCGTLVSQKKLPGFNKSDVWDVLPDCVKDAAVRDCVVFGKKDEENGLEMECSEPPPPPVVSVSGWVWSPQSAEGGVQVLMGADFQVTCSIKPKFKDGSFQLISPTASHTSPTVNNAANFSFTKAGHAHGGTYTCVYTQHALSTRSSLHITPKLHACPGGGSTSSSGGSPTIQIPTMILVLIQVYAGLIITNI